MLHAEVIASAKALRLDLFKEEKEVSDGWNTGKGEGYRFGERSRNQATEGLQTQGDECGYYLKGDGEPLEGVK